MYLLVFRFTHFDEFTFSVGSVHPSNMDNISELELEKLLIQEVLEGVDGTLIKVRIHVTFNVSDAFRRLV